MLSSTFTSQATYEGGTVVKGFEYSLKLESGAGIVPIFFGHTGDFIQQGASILKLAFLTIAGC